MKSTRPSRPKDARHLCNRPERLGAISAPRTTRVDELEDCHRRTEVGERPRSGTAPRRRCGRTPARAPSTASCVRSTPTTSMPTLCEIELDRGGPASGLQEERPRLGPGGRSVNASRTLRQPVQASSSSAARDVGTPFAFPLPARRRTSASAAGRPSISRASSRRGLVTRLSIREQGRWWIEVVEDAEEEDEVERLDSSSSVAGAGRRRRSGAGSRS